MIFENTDADQYTINRFWYNYLYIHDKNAIPARFRAWYRKRVKMYIGVSKIRA